MYPDLKKLQGIAEIMAPIEKQVSDLLGNFVPHIRSLLRKEVLFHWNKQINWSFQVMMELSQKLNVEPLRYYDKVL